MKTFLLLLLLPLHLLAQPIMGNGKNITGTWKGFVKTEEKQLPYELVISIKNGNLVAYSLTSFTVNNQEIISLKKVNLKFKDDEIIAEDDDVVFDNLTNEAAKKIKQTNKLKLMDEGETWKLTGTFETKVQRVLKPARGEVYLEKAADPAETKLMAKLAEMNLSEGLTFTPVQVAAVSTPAPSPVAVVTAPPVPVKPAVVKPAVVVAAVVEEPVFPLTRVTFKEQLRLAPNTIKKSMAITRPAKSRIYIAPVPPITRQTPVVASVPVVAPKPVTPASTGQPVTVPVIAAAKKLMPVNVAVAPALDLAKRKIETIGQMFIESDSLMLTLYDNGEVDGDSVSLVLNGKTVVSKQGLSTRAFTKTIYITPDLGDSIQLVMYAENLGTLPPNTGLLILQFDNRRQEIRFSGDLNKNAAITLRRRARN